LTIKKKVQKKKTVSRKKKTSGKKGYELKQDQDLEALDKTIEPEEEQKPEETTDPKEDLSPIPDINFESDFVLFFLETPFTRLAEAKGEHWRIAEEERERLKTLIDKLMEKYSKFIPGFVMKYSLEFTFVSYFAFMIQKRLGKDRALQAEHKEEPAKEETPEPGNPIITTQNET